jgi:hypothetical protein
MSGLDWRNEALPVLLAVRDAMIRHRASPEGGVSQMQINEELGRDRDDPATRNALVYLQDGGYISGVGSYDSDPSPRFCVLAQRGREVVAGWPSGSIDALFSSLVAEIDRRIETTESEEEKTRLRRFRDSLLGIGRDIFVNVASAYAERATGEIV